MSYHFLKEHLGHRIGVNIAQGNIECLDCDKTLYSPHGYNIPDKELAKIAKHHIQREIVSHEPCEIAVVCYGDTEEPVNVAVECQDCHVVLIDYNHPDIERMRAEC